MATEKTAAPAVKAAVPAVKAPKRQTIAGLWAALSTHREDTASLPNRVAILEAKVAHLTGETVVAPAPPAT